MEKKEPLVCPLMSSSGDEDMIWYCYKDECAWWADDECAAVTIAKGIYKIGRV